MLNALSVEKLDISPNLVQTTPRGSIPMVSPIVQETDGRMTFGYSRLILSHFWICTFRLESKVLIIGGEAE